MDDSSQDSRPLTEREKRLLHVYGKIPTAGHLSHRRQQLEGRKYFDSGDFALSQARRPSDVGAVETGSNHPLREDISRPSCPVPNSSNVESDANQQQQQQQKQKQQRQVPGGKDDASLARRGSHLGQEEDGVPVPVPVSQIVDSKRTDQTGEKKS